ncbi:MAG: two-component sensor histidine kinase [Chitinophagaceae bacterium]|nr:two-component sensor histidine kinase [Chitinophagaceae bacterium]MBK8951989.1 two-component sensor histidine kinase [Chitinophagaceae bacterium]
MPATIAKRLRRTTFVFWMLLFYIIAALVWWYVSLQHQSRLLSEQQYQNLIIKKETLSADEYNNQLSDIEHQKQRNFQKYAGEGIIFLILILVGAYFVLRSIRRQFRLQLQQQNFMMAITHELKTPISITKLNLETLQKYNLDPEKQKKIIKTTLSETARLNFLTSNILVSSQLENNSTKADWEELDLPSLLKDCLRDFQNRYPDILFRQEIDEEADVKGDALLLQMLVNNLLENAIKYSPKESPITAVLKQKNKAIYMQVKDEGPGIPDDEREKVFSKFYRIGNESTRKTQGTGLGLYLCKKIAATHNADILVTNNEPKGSIFTVTFKL